MKRDELLLLLVRASAHVDADATGTLTTLNVSCDGALVGDLASQSVASVSSHSMRQSMN